MQYEDWLYGRIDITEPVLLDVMASDAMQRLKGIFQHGITAILGITPAFNRFEHSVGTMLLVRRLGATIEEQLAALLHDISHTAFSHVIDFVFDDHREQSYHEEKKEEYIADSEIPAILHRHGMDWRAFIDEERFPLLEQPAPALCADRLDYFLRDLEFLRLANAKDIRRVLHALTVVNKQIVLNDARVAGWLAYTFIETDRASWSNFREVGLYQLTAEAIKAATRYGCLQDIDIWGTDQALWEKLKAIDHPEVSRWVALITPGTRFTWDEDQPLFRVSTKVRSIDPPVISEGIVTQYSALDPAFAAYRDNYLSAKQGLWPMGLIDSPGTKP